MRKIGVPAGAPAHVQSDVRFRPYPTLPDIS